MISIDELAELLNREVNGEFMSTIHELWEDGDSPFDPEHPVIENVLGKVIDAINEDYKYEMDEDNYDE